MKRLIRLEGLCPALCAMLLLSASLLPSTADAQKTALASGFWNSAATWSPNVVPGASDFVVIPAGITVTIDPSFAATAASVQVNDGTANTGATLTFGNAASLTVTGITSLGTNNPLAPGFLTMTTGNTLSTGGFSVNSNATGSLFTPGDGTVTLTANNTIPAIGFGTFNNLTLAAGSSGNSKTTNVSAPLSISGTLTTNAFSILNMGTSALSLSGGSIVNNGTVATQSTSATPLPPNIDWRGTTGGSVLYNASGGGQTVVAGTYNNLYLQHAGAGALESAAGGALVVGGQIATLTTGTTLNMGNNQLTNSSSGGIGAQTNVGTIRTQYIGGSNANPALPSGRTWGGTIVYDAPSGGQKIISGTYQNLSVLTNGTDLGSSDIVVNGNFVTSATTIIDLASETLTGTYDASGHAGKLLVQGETPFPTGKTFGGTVEYNGNRTQTVVANQYHNLTVSTFRNPGVTPPATGNLTFPAATIQVSGNLSLTFTTENGAVYSNAGNTIELNGTGTQTISVTATQTSAPAGNFVFNNLAINGSGTKNLLTTIRLAGTLTLTNGALAGSGTLVLLPGATTTAGNSTSYVSSPMEWPGGATSFTFPLGASGTYAPVTITASSAIGDVIAQYFRGSAYTLNGTVVAPLSRISACEYWSVNKVSGPDIQAALTWSPQSGCGGNQYVNDLANLRVARLSAGGWQTVPLAGSASSTGAGAGTITTDAEPAFDFITLATEGLLNPLPVRFITVKASRLQGAVSVRWTTATEVNVARYEIERSANGRSFEPVAQAAPRGNNGSGASYEGRDAGAPSGNVYYRVKSVDIDGRLTYSSTVRLAGRDAAPELLVTPNPLSGRELNVQTTGFAAGTYDLVLLDPIGRPVYRQRLAQDAGGSSSRFTLPGGLPAGVYQLRIEGKDTRAGMPVLLQ
ncbi:hypothetical protein [Flaviaesturariibacter flavus]|uniref:hypothetical protein n=1 Tax=Flaviaesturariibacter flavus TaxID=2502780 RepID=UPI001404C768|nr:hypothetical protein [Flaviaesturariibacter flavus]